MLNTTSTLTQAIHKRIDMLPDDMLEKAIDYILQVPEYPEDLPRRDSETASWPVQVTHVRPVGQLQRAKRIWS